MNILPKIKKAAFSLLCFGMFLFGLSNSGNAQVSFFLHGNANYLISEIEVPETRISTSMGFGAALQIYPFKTCHDLSLSVELRLVNKGYKLNYEETFYSGGTTNLLYRHDDFNTTRIVWSYSSTPILVNYNINNNIAVHAGFDFSRMIESNMHQFRDVYNKRYYGGILGITVLPKERFSLFGRVEYGFNPVLKYDNIDRYGNVDGFIEDFHNLSIVVGLKLNIFKKGIGYHEEE